MSRSALLSALGFPGWGPLHLILEEERGPQQLLQRLAPLAAAQHRLPAPQLLPLLLECLGHPLPWPMRQLPPLVGAGSGFLGHRYRLVCRPGSAVPLRLRVWAPPLPGPRLKAAAGWDPRRDALGLGLRLPFDSADEGSASGW